MYSEHIFNMVLKNTDAEVLINEERLNNVLYADNLAVFACSPKVSPGIDESCG